jgi:hypothetical protein
LLVAVVTGIGMAAIAIGACASFGTAPAEGDADARLIEDAVSPSDASTVNPIGHGTIQCIGQNKIVSTCAVGQPCCVIFGDAPDRCVEAGTTSCSGDYRSELLFCDDSTDCAPNVCCAIVASGTRYRSRCTRADECVAPNLLMCVSPADCPAGLQNCAPIMLDGSASFYSACQ